MEPIVAVLRKQASAGSAEAQFQLGHAAIHAKVGNSACDTLQRHSRSRLCIVVVWSSTELPAGAALAGDGSTAGLCTCAARPRAHVHARRRRTCRW
jgi:hypothetical protein